MNNIVLCGFMGCGKSTVGKNIARKLKTFNEQVNPMFNIISENTRENQALITLRDWLLPMLMNGQATISD